MDATEWYKRRSRESFAVAVARCARLRYRGHRKVSQASRILARRKLSETPKIEMLFYGATRRSIVTSACGRRESAWSSVALMLSATTSPRRTGTALPSCRYASVHEPAKT